MAEHRRGTYDRKGWNEKMIDMIPLNQELICQANYNSFNGTRGDSSNASYLSYVEEVMEFPIADGPKEKILKELHRRYSVVLKYEAQHISAMVTGSARYNAKKLDHGDDVLKSTHEFCVWFDGIREQVKSSQPDVMNKAENLIEQIAYYDEREELIPTNPLMELAFVDNAKFIEFFEVMLPKYRWRKNSNIYKLYLRSKAGEVKEIKKETMFEDDSLTAYKEGDRYYIKFVLRCKRQLHVALKSRGWWWNSYEKAYSTYLDRFDLDWVKSISERYAAYL